MTHVYVVYLAIIGLSKPFSVHRAKNFNRTVFDLYQVINNNDRYNSPGMPQKKKKNLCVLIDRKKYF